MHNLKRAGNKYDFLNRTTLNFLYGMDDPKKIQVFVRQSSVFLLFIGGSRSHGKAGFDKP